MNPFSMIFAPGGRIARVPYFLCLLGMVVTACVAVWLVVFSAILGTMGGHVDASGHVDPSSLMAVGAMSILFMLAVWGVMMYASINLAVKRLHDLGVSGFVVLWLYGANFLGSVLTLTHTFIGSAIYMLTILASFVFGLWLLFAPGEARYNRFGPVPEAI